MATYYENNGESSTTGPVKFNVPATTTPIPNPLNAYASYTYSWSLWWLSVADYNMLMEQANATDAMAYKLTSSYVIAEDGGLYPDQRLPATLGLNYQIQDVEFATVINPNNVTASSNLIDGQITVIEPIGCTLLDAMIRASYSNLPGQGTGYINYTQQPYMLQLDFKGYDDSGNFIPEAPPVPLSKRFPIKIIDLGIEFGKEGTQYKLHFVSNGQEAHHEEFRVLRHNVSLDAATVGEFFTKLSASMNDHFQGLVREVKIQYADSVNFEIDKTLANLPIVDPNRAEITDSGADATTFKSKTFNIPAGTAILDLIDKTMALAGIVSAQTKELGVDLQSQSKPVNIFKVQTQIELGTTKDFSAFTGAAPGTLTKQLGVFDAIRNQYPKIITYKIHQYTTWNAVHPSLPQFADSRDYSSKVYNYLFTGQNTDIIDFKLNFDFTYNTQVLSATNQKASTRTTKDTSIDENASSVRYLAANPQFGVMNTPQVLASRGGYPQLGSIPTATPMKFVPVVNNRNLTHGLGIISNPDAQKNIDALRSLYTDSYANMVSLDLTINGDPTLLKQDDWLYHAKPTDAKYSLETTGGQNTYAIKTGHVMTDTAQLVITLIVNSVTDSDVDVTNQGYMYNPDGPWSRPLFAGQYIVNTIDNKFSQGQFTQVLHLARIPNQVFATQAAGISNNVRLDSKPLAWATFAKAATAVPGNASGLTESQAASAAAQSTANQRISNSNNI